TPHPNRTYIHSTTQQLFVKVISGRALSRPPASGSGLPANVVRRSTRAAAGRDPPEHLPVRRPSGRHSPRLAPGHRLGRRDALRRSSAFVVNRQPSLLHDPGAHGVHVASIMAGPCRSVKTPSSSRVSRVTGHPSTHSWAGMPGQTLPAVDGIDPGLRQPQAERLRRPVVVHHIDDRAVNTATASPTTWTSTSC